MRQINRIIVHHSAGNPYDTVEQIREMHIKQRGRSDIGYHYIIRQGKGNPVTLEPGRPPEKIGAHSQGENADSIAVCVFGNWAENTLPAIMIRSSLLTTLVSLCKKYKLTTKDIFGHRECPGEHTLCPGFDMNLIREDVEHLLSVSQ